MVFCVFSFLLYWVDDALLEYELIVVSCRYLLQLIRVALVLRHWLIRRDMVAAANNNDVDFSPDDDVGTLRFTVSDNSYHVDTERLKAISFASLLD
mmetsp:Transcript_28093/g.39573  ORF Transcript_28093/g.39573 Transcript_28093/m.39573 type:complete len:96 (+) Transcript_28093:2-289(+)